MTLATRIAVMERGRFLQVGTPNQVYEYPVNRFVAEFVGTSNLVECRVAAAEAQRIELECAALGARFPAVPVAGAVAGATVWLAIRPEKIQLSKERPADNGRCVLEGVVADLAYYGGRSVYRVRAAGGHMLQVSAQNRQRSAERVLEWDEQVFVSWDPAANVVLTG